MPKISKKEHNIYINDNKFHTLSFDIFYNQKNLFYVTIDEQYNEILFSLKDKIDVPVTSIYGAGYHNMSDKPVSYIVKGDSENKVEELVLKLYREVIGKTLTERPVIAVFFRNDRTNYNSMKYNQEHDVLGFNYGLLYCIEKTVQGGKPDYYTTWVSPMNEADIHYQRAYLSDCTVIDDTPENRLFLEDLYSKIKNLQKALSKFLPSPELLLSTISQGLLQLESGNRPSDWCPPVEDTDYTETE